MEKFMIKKKILAASMAAATIAGSMIAQVEAIELAESDVGQVLLAPVYLVSPGVVTKIAVANTRTDYAVKAKVVFREAIHSSEVLDFIIYLSPGDVWRGTVMGDTNAAIISSDDDSFYNGSTWGSEDSAPLTQPFFDKEDSKSNGYGHFEVIGLYSAHIGTYAPTANTNSIMKATVEVKEGMSKESLRTLMDLKRISIDLTNQSEQDSLVYSGGAAISSILPKTIQLTGSATIEVEGGERASYNIPALAASNYEVTRNRGEGIVLADGVISDSSTADCNILPPYNCVSNYVITNAAFDGITAEETWLGLGFGVDLAADPGTWRGDRGDHIIDIEWALARQTIAFLYEHEGLATTNPIVSFVTKYRHRQGNGQGWDPCGDFFGLNQNEVFEQGINGDDYFQGPKEYSTPFDDTETGALNRLFTSYDNSEGTSGAPPSSVFSGNVVVPTSESLPYEVNYIPGLPFIHSSGWAYMTLAQQNGRSAGGATVACNMYSGVPALTALLKTGVSGGNFVWGKTAHR
jgi:hypothetical protein